MYSVFLLSRRRFNEARTQAKLARDLDPLMPLLYAYSMWIHMSSGRPGEVLDDLAREPRFRAFLDRLGLPW